MVARPDLLPAVLHHLLWNKDKRQIKQDRDDDNIIKLTNDGDKIWNQVKRQH